MLVPLASRGVVGTARTMMSRPTAVAAASVTGIRRRRTRTTLERERETRHVCTSVPRRSLVDVATAESAAGKSAAVSTKPTGDGERNWTWATPSPLRPGRGMTPALPIKPRVNLTVEEVVAAVESQGALDVRVVDLKGKASGMGDAFVFCTCTTPLHMRRLSDIIVYALKRRKLKNAVGITGAEGYDCDDWMLVDCDNLMVHFMTKEAREELQLEEYWSNARLEEDSALRMKREKGEDGLVEDAVDWEEDFGEEYERAAERAARLEAKLTIEEDEEELEAEFTVEQNEEEVLAKRKEP